MKAERKRVQKMRIALVEDMERDRDILSSYIQKYLNEQNVAYKIYSCRTADEEPEDTGLHMMDVIFLDIYIGEQNGFDVAKNLREKGYGGLLVFCTVTPDYALAGYKVKAFDYIVKPYSYEAIERVMRDILKVLKKEDQSICIKENRQWYKVPLRDILYVENSANYVRVYTQSRVYSTRMAFHQMEEMLRPYECFVQCNRGTVVNLSCIRKMDGQTAVLQCKDGTQAGCLPVSRKNVKELNRRYMDYIFGKLDSMNFL